MKISKSFFIFSISILSIGLIVVDCLNELLKWFSENGFSFDPQKELERSRRSEQRERRKSLERERRNALRAIQSKKPVNLRKMVFEENNPNESFKQWGLASIGITKIKEQLKREVLVAVIDTGVDKRHPDLQKNIWSNPGETGLDKFGRDKRTNGIDDDKNGFIDDVHGWNFADNNNNIRDEHGHGTHIAGIIAAERDNGIGIQGMVNNVKILPIKFYSDKLDSYQNIQNTAKAIRYAVDMGAKVINYSAGGASHSNEEENAIEYAKKHNVVFVAAAGNYGENTDKLSYFPANYNLSNILSVGAFGKDNKILKLSNYGKDSVDVLAPGEDIYSTTVGGGYGYLSGTSQATAFASGLTAQIISKYPQIYKPEDIIKVIGLSGEVDKDLFFKTRFSSRINSYNAINMLN